MSKKRILVTGSTGNLGSAVVKALLAKKFEVVAATTNPENKPSVHGVLTKKFVFGDSQLTQQALKGCQGLFLMAPPLDVEAAAKLNPMIDAAKIQGIDHVVLNTAIGVDQAQGTPLNLVENYLKSSGLAYTILRPNFFMENFSSGFAASMVCQGGIYLAAGNSETSFISVEDIALVAACAFQDHLVGKEYTLTGPQAFNHHQVAQIISNYSAKAVVYHSLSEAEMVQACRNNKMPESAVQYLAMLYSAVRNGYTAACSPDVELVTARAPISFEVFANKIKSVWN